MTGQDEALIRQIRRVLLLGVGLLLLGTAGYMLLEGLSFLDALYMTVITLGTVGYREVGPVEPAGQVFTILLIAVGVGGVAYTGATVVQYVVEGRVGGVLYRRRIRAMIDKLSNHVILCGYGRVGQAVAQELRHQGVSCVVVDARDDRVDLANKDGFPALCGDASSDETLLAVGIARARSLVSAVDSDAENIYIALSARVLAPGLYIVSRASDRHAEAKLLRVGASRVLSPYTIAGRHLALLSVRSAVVDFVYSVISGEEGPSDPHRAGHDLRLENIVVSVGGWLRGRTPADVRAHLHDGATLLAVTTRNGEITTNLTGSPVPLQPGDVLILIGTPAQLKEVERLA